MKLLITIFVALLFLGTVFAAPIIAADCTKQAIKTVPIIAQEKNTKVICKGDINKDNQINFDDINPFSWIIRHSEQCENMCLRKCWAADINNDGIINNADINPFVAILSGWQEPICISVFH